MVAHDTMQPQALALVVLFPALSTVFVALRVWIKITMKQFRSDDWLCVVAWALAVAYAGVVYYWIQVNWFGYHVWDIPQTVLSTENQILSSKLNMAQQLLYNPILGIVKASIILFLLRLDDRRPIIRNGLIAFFIFNFGHTVSVFFAAMTQCLPIHQYWDHFRTDQIVDGVTINPNYSCFDEEVFSLTTAGLAILTDILILTIPIAMTWPLRLNIRRKVAVTIVLSLGWVVVIVGAIRLKIFYDYWAGTSGDPTYGLSQTVSGIEVNVAIITSCGPALKAIMTRFAPRFFGSSGGTRPSGNGTYLAQGYEMHRQSTQKGDLYAGPSTPRRTMQRDIDADSQEEIIIHDSLGSRKGDAGMAL